VCQVRRDGSVPVCVSAAQCQSGCRCCCCFQVGVVRPRRGAAPSTSARGPPAGVITTPGPTERSRSTGTGPEARLAWQAGRRGASETGEFIVSGCQQTRSLARSQRSRRASHRAPGRERSKLGRNAGYLSLSHRARQSRDDQRLCSVLVAAPWRLSSVQREQSLRRSRQEDDRQTAPRALRHSRLDACTVTRTAGTPR